MSVIVRGMEMPENCLKCPFQMHGLILEFCLAKSDVKPKQDKRPANCPLFEVKDWREI